MISAKNKCFPKGHILRKIFNRNTLKVSYSCTQNLEAIISAKNAKLLSSPEDMNVRMCNCRENFICLLEGKCLT